MFNGKGRRRKRGIFGGLYHGGYSPNNDNTELPPPVNPGPTDVAPDELLEPHSAKDKASHIRREDSMESSEEPSDISEHVDDFDEVITIRRDDEGGLVVHIGDNDPYRAIGILRSVLGTLEDATSFSCIEGRYGVIVEAPDLEEPQ